MEKKYYFNANMAKENVEAYEKEIQKLREVKAVKTVNNFLATIDRISQNGIKSIPLQSPHIDAINDIVEKDLEELGFSVERQGQKFTISWS